MTHDTRPALTDGARIVARNGKTYAVADATPYRDGKGAERVACHPVTNGKVTGHWVNVKTADIVTVTA